MGIGIDIVQISRIKNPDLLAKGILTDKELEIYHQKGINKIQFLAGRYAGKEAFMKAEAKACQYLKEKIDALPETGIKAVIATGGGICNNQAAVDILKSAGILVFLNSDEETAVSRIIREIKIESNGSLSNLPAYIAVENPKSLNDVRISFHKFYVARQSIYNSLCNVTVNMKPVTKSENRDAIIDALARCK